MPAKKKPTSPPATSGDFDSLVSAIVHIHQQSQSFASKAVNVSLTVRNWLIGQRIVEFEQSGKDRAAYGERLLPALAERCTGKNGALGDLSNQIFVSRYAVELPRKEDMERFTAQIGREVGA